MRFLTYFGPIVALAVIVTCVALVFATFRGPGLDQESHAFVDCAVPAITSTWDEQALTNRASPKLLKGPAREQMYADLIRYRKLGRLRAYDGATGDTQVSVGLDGIDVTGEYFAKARFDSGDADLKIGLIKKSGDWRIDEFRIDSAALPPAAGGQGQAALEPAVESIGDADLNAYGPGVDGFERWARTNHSAWAFRYQSASEAWIAISDSYGPFPSQELAERIGNKYLSFVDDTDTIRIILFRTNEKGAEATVTRQAS